MEKDLSQLYQILQKLVGLHRQLMDVVRSEREALVSADLKGIQEATYVKESLIQSIYVAENERLKLMGELAAIWKKSIQDLTLPNIIIEIQGRDPKSAEQLRGTLNVLTILIQRISEQNRSNREFVERSLQHVQNMKSNVLGESTVKAETYSPHGQKINATGSSRLLSKEV